MDEPITKSFLIGKLVYWGQLYAGKFKTLLYGCLSLTKALMLLIGVVLTLVSLLLITQPDWRNASLRWVSSFSQSLVDKSYVKTPSTAKAIQQTSEIKLAKVVTWLKNKYKVGSEPLTLWLNTLIDLARQKKMDPILLIALVSIESGFNPVAESSQGAQGLMQILYDGHKEKLVNFGQGASFFDPTINMQVGVEIFHSLLIQSDTLEMALNLYNGQGRTSEKTDFVVKFLNEYQRLARVFEGQKVSVNDGGMLDFPHELLDQLWNKSKSIFQP